MSKECVIEIAIDDTRELRIAAYHLFLEELKKLGGLPNRCSLSFKPWDGLSYLGIGIYLDDQNIGAITFGSYPRLSLGRDWNITDLEYVDPHFAEKLAGLVLNGAKQIKYHGIDHYNARQTRSTSYFNHKHDQNTP